MSKHRPKVLTKDELYLKYCDLITVFNITCEGYVVIISQIIYDNICKFDLLDDVCFNIHVTSFKHFPIEPFVNELESNKYLPFNPPFKNIGL